MNNKKTVLVLVGVIVTCVVAAICFLTVPKQE